MAFYILCHEAVYSGTGKYQAVCRHTMQCTGSWSFGFRGSFWLMNHRDWGYLMSLCGSV